MKPFVELEKTGMEELTFETLNELRGGKAEVVAQQSIASECGDGSKYVCCIEIDLNR